LKQSGSPKHGFHHYTTIDRIGNQIEAAFIFARAWAGRLEATPGLIVKGKRISCPPHHDYEHGFPLIRSLRASAQRSTSVLFSFVLSLLIVARSFAIWQSKTILARSCEAESVSFLRADEKLTAFVELESAVRACGELPRQAGEIFPKLPGYETKHSTSSNHICARLLCARPKHASGQPTTGRRLPRTQHGRRAKRPFESHHRHMEHGGGFRVAQK
jgi:hypothetical protein